jgi:hypothetical protein
MVFLLLSKSRQLTSSPASRRVMPTAPVAGVAPEQVALENSWAERLIALFISPQALLSACPAVGLPTGKVDSARGVGAIHLPHEWRSFPRKIGVKTIL